ncbi:MAG: hypothetical protein NC251_01755 [Lachnoclostridium sp.]|nr:hypothetical protein [Lachnospira sp.]MCM1247133.1 hypothetical protein [Lachnoclostridium sp.]MCM1536261.1 hypothetical protein [Clostridium sp.]
MTYLAVGQNPKFLFFISHTTGITSYPHGYVSQASMPVILLPIPLL